MCEGSVLDEVCRASVNMKQQRFDIRAVGELFWYDSGSQDMLAQSTV